MGLAFVRSSFPGQRPMMEKGESLPKRRFPLVDLSESPYSPEARETRRSSANVGKKRERRPVTPRAPWKTSGEVTYTSWPQRRRPRRRPQRARRSNASVISLTGNQRGRWCAAPPFYRASQARGSRLLPYGTISRPAGFTSVVAEPVIVLTGATFPEAIAENTSTAASLVTNGSSVGSRWILSTTSNVVA